MEVRGRQTTKEGAREQKNKKRGGDEEKKKRMGVLPDDNKNG